MVAKGDTLAVAPSVPIPIAHEPIWVGLEVGLQWAAVTPVAPNGLFVTSDGLRVTVGMP